MATDLWTKFKSAVRYGWEAGPKAIVAVALGSFETDFVELLADGNTLNGAPALGTDGVNVEGLKTIDICAIFSAAAQSAEFRFWLYNGVDWCAPEATKTITAPTGISKVYIEPLDLETFQRVYAELVTAPGSGTVQLKSGPYNDETP